MRNGRACVKHDWDKMCWIWEAAFFVGTGCTCLIDATAQLPRIRQTPPHSQDSAADVQQKSCIVSAPFVNLARPLRPIRHVKLNHCRISISLGEQRPRCRREGRGSRSASGALYGSLIVMLFVRLMVLPWRWCPALSVCYCVVGIISKGGQLAGIKAGYRLGRHSVRQVVNLWVG